MISVLGNNVDQLLCMLSVTFTSNDYMQMQSLPGKLWGLSRQAENFRNWEF